MSEPNDHIGQDELALADRTARHSTRRGPQSAHTAIVRVSGGHRDIANILMILEAGARRGGYQITGRRGPYASHRRPGVRMHFTLEFADSVPARETSSRPAAS